jgi:hypothetical protein
MCDCDNCNCSKIELKEYVDALFAAHTKEHAMLEKSIDDAREALSKSIDTSREALNIRLEAMNEFRAQIQDERGTFATNDKLDLNFRNIENLIETRKETHDKETIEENKKMDRIDNALSVIKGRWSALVGGGGLLLLLVELLLKFVVK